MQFFMQLVSQRLDLLRCTVSWNGHCLTVDFKVSSRILEFRRHMKMINLSTYLKIKKVFNRQHAVAMVALFTLPNNFAYIESKLSKKWHSYRHYNIHIDQDILVIVCNILDIHKLSQQSVSGNNFFSKKFPPRKNDKLKLGSTFIVNLVRRLRFVL